MTILEKMRSRSNVEKRIIAFNIALIITLIIFAIWIISKFYSADWGFGDSVQAAYSPMDFVIDSAKTFFGGITGN